MDSNENKRNWAEDFGINELLHSRSQNLAGAYSRLAYNLPKHADAKKWDEKGLVWARYNRAIKDLVFSTEEEGNEEANRLSVELKAVLALEKAFIKQNPA